MLSKNCKKEALLLTLLPSTAKTKQEMVDRLELWAEAKWSTLICSISFFVNRISSKTKKGEHFKNVPSVNPLVFTRNLSKPNLGKKIIVFSFHLQKWTCTQGITFCWLKNVNKNIVLIKTQKQHLASRESHEKNFLIIHFTKKIKRLKCELFFKIQTIESIRMNRRFSQFSGSTCQRNLKTSYLIYLPLWYKAKMEDFQANSLLCPSCANDPRKNSPKTPALAQLDTCA